MMSRLSFEGVKSGLSSHSLCVVVAVAHHRIVEKICFSLDSFNKVFNFTHHIYLHLFNFSSLSIKFHQLYETSKMGQFAEIVNDYQLTSQKAPS